MSLLNDPIENVAYHELHHNAATKGDVDDRFIAYTPTKQINFNFESLYAKKWDLQTTDLSMLALLRNISQSSIPDPFAFLDYKVTFFYRETLAFPFNKAICCHFDPVAS